MIIICTPIDVSLGRRKLPMDRRGDPSSCCIGRHHERIARGTQQSYCSGYVRFPVRPSLWRPRRRGARNVGTRRPHAVDKLPAGGSLLSPMALVVLFRLENARSSACRCRGWLAVAGHDYLGDRLSYHGRDLDAEPARASVHQSRQTRVDADYRSGVRSNTPAQPPASFESTNPGARNFVVFARSSRYERSIRWSYRSGSA